MVSSDLDNDGLPDLVAGGADLQVFHNVGGRFEPWDLGLAFEGKGGWSSLAVFENEINRFLGHSPSPLALFFTSHIFS